MNYQPVAYIQVQHSAEAPAADAEMQQEQALPEGFVYLDEALPGVLWDAKYASEDNFTGQVVPGYAANRIVISKKMVSALEKARDLAVKQGHEILVWDAARPQRAVDWFVEWSKLPEDGKTKAAHYPNIKKTWLFQQGYVAKRSGHSRGAAIDLTLCDAQTHEPLDMGTSYDLMDDKSHHGAKGLTKSQRQNRAALKKIMEQSGFSAYQNEWWHYSLKGEPFPGQYFDFAILPAPTPEPAGTPEPVVAMPSLFPPELSQGPHATPPAPQVEHSGGPEPKQTEPARIVPANPMDIR